MQWDGEGVALQVSGREMNHKEVGMKVQTDFINLDKTF
jgi:translation initiation factor IF-3